MPPQVGRWARRGWLHSAWRYQPLPQRWAAPAAGWRRSLFRRGQLRAPRWGCPCGLGRRGSGSAAPPRQARSGPFTEPLTGQSPRLGQPRPPHPRPARGRSDLLGGLSGGRGASWALAEVGTDPRWLANGPPGSSFLAPPPTKVSGSGKERRRGGRRVGQAGAARRALREAEKARPGPGSPPARRLHPGARGAQSLRAQCRVTPSPPRAPAHLAHARHHLFLWT